VRVTWAVLPLVLGPALGDALDAASRPVQLVVSAGAWAGWVAVLVATLVPSVVSLTVVRLAAPLPLAAASIAAIAGPAGLDDAIALAAGVAAAAVVVLPSTTDAFVDGSSYGTERRFGLATPPRLLLGPAPVAWLLAIAAPAAASIALAAGSWVLGAGLAVIAVPGVVLGVPALHRLSRRWLVFVPAGLVVHDHLSLAEPILLPRRFVASVEPAAGAAEPGVDLTLGARGVGVVVGLVEAIELPVAVGLGRRRRAEIVRAEQLLVAPLRPGAVLHEAEARRLPVHRPT